MEKRQASRSLGSKYRKILRIILMHLKNRNTCYQMDFASNTRNAHPLDCFGTALRSFSFFFQNKLKQVRIIDGKLRAVKYPAILLHNN